MAQKSPSSELLKRKAISPSGSLGDFYDIHTDCWVEKCKLTSKGQVAKDVRPKLLHCKLLKGNRNEVHNLLDLIGIENELQVNLLRNIAPTVGIGGLVNYPRKIDEFTRIISYSYLLTAKTLAKNDGKDVTGLNEKKISENATHIVSKIDTGIDAFIILQIPDNMDIASIDNSLQQFRKILSDGGTIHECLEKKDHNTLKPMSNVTIYSNISSLTQVTKLFEIPSRIASLRQKDTQCAPIKYYFQSVSWLYPQYSGKEIISHRVPSDIRKVLEELYDLRILKNHLEIFFRSNEMHILTTHLKEHISKISHQWAQLAKAYDELTKQISRIDTTSYRNRKTKLRDDMQQLLELIHELQAKAKFINELRVNNIEYRTATKADVVKRNNEEDCNEHAIWSTDELNRKNSTQLKSFLMNRKKKNNDSVRLVYVDFSYCDYELSKMIVLPRNSSNQEKSKGKKKAQKTKSSSDATQKPPTKQYDTINILLLGESGVGKSTFINAFANYLSSQTFKEAKTKDPTVLITASFLITTGANFEEHIIKLVDFDNSNNEDFDNPGQSVTQQCRSYVFTIQGNREKKLRIIDTPGFGDTRGINQDDINIEHTLQFINNLTHLDAICFLCKPNSSRLNIFFRSCILKLFSLLDANAQQNLLFCFTNARSTFYTPGDTAPLIMEMLRSLPNNNISFQKKNVFCFDNESFRYLVSLRHGITFDECDERDYETSWTKSVEESIRLLNYVKTLPIYDLQDERQTNKHAQIQIELLIRPILETVRNSQRNLFLYEKNIKNQWIDMCATHLHEVVFQCHGCRQRPTKIGQFSIIVHQPHKIIQNECTDSDCSCAFEKHKPMNYLLEYDIDSDDSFSDGRDCLQKICVDLCNISAEFAYFLFNIEYQFKETMDPLTMNFNEMVEEEKELNSNLHLHKRLRELYQMYEAKFNKLKSTKKKILLSDIYKLINHVKEYKVIDQQMKAIKQTQEFLMEKYEYIVN